MVANLHFFVQILLFTFAQIRNSLKNGTYQRKLYKGADFCNIQLLLMGFIPFILEAFTRGSCGTNISAQDDLVSGVLSYYDFLHAQDGFPYLSQATKDNGYVGHYQFFDRS